ncbi:hypothetical protein BC940DRAFT_127562 [Gongronella butleri]|nr:hypothetical protein BC940DRAFT_127562 [Gongronella butleri]
MTLNHVMVVLNIVPTDVVVLIFKGHAGRTNGLPFARFFILFVFFRFFFFSSSSLLLVIASFGTHGGDRVVVSQPFFTAPASFRSDDREPMTANATLAFHCLFYNFFPYCMVPVCTISMTSCIR